MPCRTRRGAAIRGKPFQLVGWVERARPATWETHGSVRAPSRGRGALLNGTTRRRKNIARLLHSSVSQLSTLDLCRPRPPSASTSVQIRVTHITFHKNQDKL